MTPHLPSFGVGNFGHTWDLVDRVGDTIYSEGHLVIYDRDQSSGDWYVK